MFSQRPGAEPLLQEYQALVTQKENLQHGARLSILGSHLRESFSSESLSSLQEKKRQLIEGTKVSNRKVTITAMKRSTVGIIKNLVCFLSACSLYDHIYDYTEEEAS